MKMIMDLLSVLKGKTMFSNTFDSQYKHKYSKSLVFILILTLIVPVYISFPQPKTTQAAPNEWENVLGQTLNQTNGRMITYNEDSQFPSIAFDSSGYICIVWNGDSNVTNNWDIYFARWNGSNWVNAAGNYLTTENGNVSNNSGTSIGPKIVMKSNNPCITWGDTTPGNWEIYYAEWNGSNWVNASGLLLTATNGNVSNNNSVSNLPSLELNSFGNPCIAWSDKSNGNREIFFSRWNGSKWVNASGVGLTSTNGNISNNFGYSGNPSLDIDDSNNPFIAWLDDTTGNNEIFLSKWNGSNWVNASGILLDSQNGNVSNNNGSSTSPSLKLLSNYPSICWCDTLTGNSDVYYTSWNGSNWVNIKGSMVTNSNCNVSNSLDNSWEPQLEFDNLNGFPCIVWRERISNDEIFFVRWNGSNWVNAQGATFTTSNGNISNNSSTSWHPCLALDTSGNPFIAWTDSIFSPQYDDIIIAKFNGTLQNNTYEFLKTVDIDSDNDFADNNENVYVGQTITYKVNITLDVPQNIDYNNAYFVDTIPYGAKYVDGSAQANGMSVIGYTRYQGGCEKEGKLAYDDSQMTNYPYSVVLKCLINPKIPNQVITYKVKIMDISDSKLGKTIESKPAKVIIPELYDKCYETNATNNSLFDPSSQDMQLVMKYPAGGEKFPVNTKQIIRWDFKNIPIDEMKDKYSIYPSFKRKGNDYWETFKDRLGQDAYFMNPKERIGLLFIDPEILGTNESVEIEFRLIVRKFVNNAIVFEHISLIGAKLLITKYPAVNYAKWIDPYPEKTDRSPLLFISGFSFFSNRSTDVMSDGPNWDDLMNFFVKTTTAPKKEDNVFYNYKPYVLSYDTTSSWFFNYCFREKGDAYVEGKLASLPGCMSGSDLLDADKNKVTANAQRWRKEIADEIKSKYRNDLVSLKNKYSPTLDSLEEIGQKVIEDIEKNSSFFGSLKAGGKFYMIGHSLGGVTARSIMMAKFSNGVQCGDYVGRLITLASPHHGTPFANSPWNILAPSSSLLNDNPLGFLFLEEQTPNRLVEDIMWDGFDKELTDGKNNLFLKKLNGFYIDKTCTSYKPYFEKICAYGTNSSSSTLDYDPNPPLDERNCEQKIRIKISEPADKLMLSYWRQALKWYGYEESDGIIPLRSSLIMNYTKHSSALFDSYSTKSGLCKTFDESTTGKLHHASIVKSGSAENIFLNITADLLKPLPISSELCTIQIDLRNSTINVKNPVIKAYVNSEKPTISFKVNVKQNNVQETTKFPVPYKEVTKEIPKASKPDNTIRYFKVDEEALKKRLILEILNLLLKLKTKPKSVGLPFITTSVAKPNLAYESEVEVDGEFLIDDGLFESSITSAEGSQENDIGMKISIILPKPELSLSTTLNKTHMGKKDTFKLSAVVSNISFNFIENSQLLISIPNDIRIVSSQPNAVQTGNNVVLLVNNLGPNQSAKCEIIFAPKDNLRIPENGLNISLSSVFRNGTLFSNTESNNVTIRNDVNLAPVSLNVTWQGFSTKTNTIKHGDEISAKITPEGGSSPYQITIDWGDSNRSKKSDVTSDNPPTLTHTYNDAGEYTITIICTDQYGNVCKITRNIFVKQ